MLRTTSTMLATVAAAALTGSAVALAASDADPIGDFQADISPGNVSAADILGLPASAITSIHAPKDFVAVIGGLNSDKASQGFGVSFTPARTRMMPVTIGDYSNNMASRLWASTTFSYAQNRPTYGDAEYHQDAVAIHGSYYLKPLDDPAVAVHAAFANCKPVKVAMSELGDDLNKLRKDVRVEIIAAQRTLGKSEAEATAVADELADTVSRPRQEALRREKREQFTVAARQCVDDAAARAAAKWNASQLAYTLGAGWVRGSGGGAPRLSLGRSVYLAAALQSGPNALTHLTVKHTSKAVDTDTLATTPVYKASTLAAARWTYGHGDKAGLFALAEVSNAKASRATVDNSVFKAAIGLDKRLFDGGWLEFRIGRKRSIDGGKEETVGLMNFKLAPGASLPKLPD